MKIKIVVVGGGEVRLLGLTFVIHQPPEHGGGVFPHPARCLNFLTHHVP